MLSTPSLSQGREREKTNSPLLHPWVLRLLKTDLCLAHPHPRSFFLSKVPSSLPWSPKPSAPRTAGLEDADCISTASTATPGAQCWGESGASEPAPGPEAYANLGLPLPPSKWPDFLVGRVHCAPPAGFAGPRMFPGAGGRCRPSPAADLV